MGNGLCNDSGFTFDCSNYGYDCGDISVLQQFIDVNSEIFRHYMDYNNNSTLEPLEFGYQVWDNGRLIEFCSSNWSSSVCFMWYELSGEIPIEIWNLTNLSFLNF